MQAATSYRLQGQQLWLSPERCIFWEEERSLILSDLHFGKTGHFRKSGIAVPQTVYQEDLQRLLTLIHYFQPQQLLVVGDLFHSRENKELELFRRWRDDFAYLHVRLIRGNHDILEDSWYEQAGIEVIPEKLRIRDFEFVHDITAGSTPPPDAASKSYIPKSQISNPPAYSFSGHIHPAIRINGMGRQSLRFPCFHFGEAYAILPAFGRFTGMASVRPEPRDQVFAILPPSPRKGELASIVQIQ